MTIRKKEFGDFQTSTKLARQICQHLWQQDISPATIVEPTCGQGSFVFASLEYFPQAKTVFGVDINANHIDTTRHELNRLNLGDKAKVGQGNFFDLDWPSILAQFPDPLLIIGNPPWVTNSTLGLLNRHNLPQKENFHKHAGLDALTGQSNFDISEWMLIHLIAWINGRDSILAMLVKTSVARRVLKYFWQNGIEIGQSHLYLLDGKQEFGVSVAMCLLVCHTKGTDKSQTCKVYQGLDEETFLTTFGFRDGHLVANIKTYTQWKHLRPIHGTLYQWRSGIKHDAAKIMELTKDMSGYQNNLGETWALEEDYIYPLLKSSDIANDTGGQPHRWVLVPQSYVGESTIHIKHKAPNIWVYLKNHSDFFNKRKSSIYKNKPPFSIFGIGDYSFASWKVAISGLHKTLTFVSIGPYQNKPVILDDTCYFIPCTGKGEADFLTSLLNTPVAQEFFRAFIFWDSKRPITANILRNLDILLLAQELGLEQEMKKYASLKGFKQLSLWSPLTDA